MKKVTGVDGPPWAVPHRNACADDARGLLEQMMRARTHGNCSAQEVTGSHDCEALASGTRVGGSFRGVNVCQFSALRIVV